MEVSEISTALRRDADALARLLLPNGRYETPTEYKCRGSLSPTGEPISVHVGPGPKQGLCGFWTEAREGGDMLDLVELVMGTDKAGAIKWAKDYLGISDGNHIRRVHAEPTRRQAQSARQDEVRRDEDGIRRRSVAASIWRSSEPLSGAPLNYLRSRGLSAKYADGEIRTNHSLAHPSGGTFPAVVARVQDEHGKGCGIWRIFVKMDGTGKAPVDTPKMGLGDVAGGAARVGGIWTDIGVTEGIETALACRQIIDDGKHTPIPVWAALSAAGMRNLIIPDGVRRVRIFADNDTPSIRQGKLRPSPGISAAQALYDRLIAAGIACEIVKPPVGQDWLDVLNAEQRIANG